MSDTTALEDVPPVDESSPPPADEPEAVEPPAEPPTEPPVDEPEAPAAPEPATEPPAEQLEVPDVVAAILEENPEAGALLETEQAIDRAIAAPEAPAVAEPEPLPEQKADVTSFPEGPVENIEQAAEDANENVKETVDDVKEASVSDAAVPGAPSVAAPSAVSKKSKKLGNIKARVTRKVLPKVLGIGAPKEAVPLVALLRQKKKNGEDVGKLVNMCMVALGA